MKTAHSVAEFSSDPPRHRIVAFVMGLATVCWLVGGFLVNAAVSQEANPKLKEKVAPDEQRRLLKVFVSEFVEITPGEGQFPKSFDMGSGGGPATETPERKVTFNYGFAIAKYEVPQNLFAAVTGANPSVWQGPERGRNSVEMVSWIDAKQFCAATTKLLRDAELIGTNELIRLPSEAEWEYCCRAGTTTAFSFGDSATRDGDTGNAASVLNAFGWHTGNAAGNDPPVGALKPNPWGLYDTHGYLWEFVSDAWHDSYAAAPTDGSAWDAQKQHVPRVIRGGSWRDPFDSLRSTSRWPIPDHAKSDAVGFRCVKTKVN